MKTDVLIVGGGIAGLTCAVALRDSGLRVTVVERERYLGGRAASFHDVHSGDVIDIGPHIFLSEYRNLSSLLRISSTDHRISWQKDRLITLLNDGQKSVMRTHRLPPPFHLFPSLLKADDVSMRDKTSNFAAIRMAMSLTEDDVRRLDRRNAHELLVELGVSRGFIDWFWRSASMSLMNVPLEKCSAGALMRFYKHLIGHNDLRIGFAGCGLAELFAPQAKQIIEAGRGEVITDATVQAMHGANHRCEAVVLGDGSRIDARYFVAALPPAALAAVMPEHGMVDGHIERFQPSPYISVYLWLDRKVTDLQFWAQVWSPTALNYDFYDLSNIRAGWSERPSIIASNIIYSSRCDHLSDEEIVRTTIKELASFGEAAAKASVVHSVVHRIPMAIPCPYVGTEQARPSARTSFSNLWLAGDWTQTHLPASMESAARSGFLAAEAIWQDIGRPQELAQLPKPTTGLTGWMQRAAHRNHASAA